MTFALAARAAGAAIVGVRWLPDGMALVIAIERYSSDASLLAERIAALRGEHPDALVIIDSEGIGGAIWKLSGARARQRLWQLYAAHGAERHELTTSLVFAIERPAVRFADGLAERESMQKALLSVSRDVHEGGPDSELAVALALAVSHPPRGPVTMF
jgi:hypothetical protein